MPRKKKPASAGMTELPSIPKELIEQLAGSGLPMTAEQINATTMALKKALIERALGAELSHHLGYPPGTAKPEAASNQRNGKFGKTVLTEDGPLRIAVPRDRAGSFEPILIPKHQRRFTGFDDKIVAMYARGMTVRETDAPAGFEGVDQGLEWCVAWQVRQPILTRRLFAALLPLWQHLVRGRTQFSPMAFRVWDAPQLLSKDLALS
ncbi:mutator family transposase [Tahibacter aquaticus]|uniref:Mutator family transposase n=1 Tax=Tahibacter aquaticus TaxID=520092 RepID=A0A4R6YM68_9GAMM|nr:mutator family transposase [Tahibacter aquaticus]